MLTRQMNKGGYYLLYLFMIGLFLGILLVNIRYDIWTGEDGLLMAASIFPQGFLLIPGYFLLLQWGLDCHRELYGRVDGLDGRYLAGSQFIVRKGMKLLGILLIIISGCVVESYVNPKIVHFILKIF